MRTGQMSSGGQRTRAACLVLGLALTALSTTGCRTTEGDVQRWAETKQGPRKLVAVVTHDKYPMELRVEAALTLVRMKPRGGQRVGLQGSGEYEGLLDALERIPPAARAELMARLAPRLIAEMRQMPTENGIDTTYPYKDAAFALLTHDNGRLVSDPKIRRLLENALIDWSSSSFETRLADASQLFGLEQVLRELKAAGVRPLADLIGADQEKYPKIASLIAELGDAQTKQRASENLAKLARYVDSPAYLETQRPILAKANAELGIKLKEKEAELQLEEYQAAELSQIFVAANRLGGRPVVEHLLAFAESGENPAKQRAEALLALRGHLDPDDKEQAEILLKLAQSDESPDQVREVTLRLLSELPRERVVERLYGLFDNKRWQIRWVVAQLILKMSEAEHVPGFMKNLSQIREMALSEPLVYGPLIGTMKGGEDLIDRYAAGGNPVAARLTALGYYYAEGTREDLPKVEPFTADRTPVPTCGADATDCSWECAVEAAARDGSDGGAQSGGQAELKEVKTLGQYVEYCIIPAMQKRSAAKKPKTRGSEESQGGAER